VTLEAATANTSPPPLLVWDAAFEPWQWDGHIALWKGLAQDGANNTTSIHSMVEEKADELRAHYLAWIYDFGEALIDGKRVIDHLELRLGFSYWWMTLPGLASYGGDETSVYNAVRMLALENLARDLGCKSITLVSDDQVLVATIRKWCGNAGLIFQLHHVSAKANPISFAKKIFRVLPYPLQGLIFLLRYIKQRWPLRGNAAHIYKDSTVDITFVDYLLINLNSQDASQGRFCSNYWTYLVNILQGDGVKANWIHHYVPLLLSQSARQVRNLIDKFNKNEGCMQSHIALDSALCLPVLWGVVRDYMHILAMGIKLCSTRLPFIPKESDVDFEPLIREEWRKCMFGNVAVLNCLFLNQFEFLLKAMPRQRIGVYLQENQPWEMAFIHAWKSGDHGQLVGVPHSTVIFWDMPYYFDPRSYKRSGSNNLPLPDLVALNGPASMNRYCDGGYPEDQMVEVEALRYLYLNKLSPRCLEEGKVNPQKTLHVLVLGDYLLAAIRHQIELLAAAVKLLPFNTHCTVKPHPACEINSIDYPLLHIHMTSAPLAELLADCDVAFTSNITSAAVDAYVAGVPVVSVLDGNSFNMSPLRGLAGVVYVNTAVELAVALRNARNREIVATEPYFCLDKDLPRWRKLLGLSPTGITKNVEVRDETCFRAADAR
jgi:surface carbohydrate biosynthesis protein (TIGR04326 family)